MLAIKRIRQQIEVAPESSSSQVLGGLVVALAQDSPVDLGSLYRLDRASFELALELLQDWRIERLYSERLEEFRQVRQAHAHRQIPRLHS